MKLIITDYKDYSEVVVRDETGINLHVYTFDDKKTAQAFCTGFQCAKTVINGLVQSLPLSYEAHNPPTEPETIGQQLSKQWVGRA